MVRIRFPPAASQQTFIPLEMTLVEGAVSPLRTRLLSLPKRRFSGFRARCGLKLIHDFLRLSSCPRTAYQNRRSAPKTKRSGTQPNESGWRSGGAVSFQPTPTGMRNGPTDRRH